MAKELNREKEAEKQEQALAREQRRQFQEELAKHNTPVRAPTSRSRVITVIGLAIIAVCAGLFGWLVLLPSASPTPVAAIAVGAPAPNFTLPVYGGSNIGSNIDLRALRGHPVVINFWSKSCSPCLSEIPYLEQVYSQQGQNRFILLGIDQTDPKIDIAPFGVAYKLTYPLLFDPGGAVNQSYGVTAIPTTYFVDSQGIVRAAFVTELSAQTMRQGLASIGVSLS